MQTTGSNKSRRGRAFTLIELLVVIAIIALLAALVVPTLDRGGDKAPGVQCMNHLRQLAVASFLYSEDYNDTLPGKTNSAPPSAYADFQLSLRGYLSSSNNPSPSEKLFACPDDTFYYADGKRYAESQHLQAAFQYSSYAFNVGNSIKGFSRPGLQGRKVSSIKKHDKTILVTEWPAFLPYSWHHPADPYSSNNPPYFNNALNVVGFADGHASVTKIYWDSNNSSPTHAEARQYDPPAGYDYKWSCD